MSANKSPQGRKAVEKNPVSPEPKKAPVSDAEAALVRQKLQMGRELIQRFSEVQLDEGQVKDCRSLLARARDLSFMIADSSGLCREQLIALQRVEEAIHWANAAIARRK